MIKFPYAIREFDKIIQDGYLYLDRTQHIPFLEDWGEELLLLRPRRFGKSLWLSTLMNYYDIAKKDDFQRLFGHLAVGQKPTPLHNTYLIMKWDFSKVAASGSIDEIQASLNKHINIRATIFQSEYGRYLEHPIEIDDNALSTFDLLVNQTRLSGHKLYLFIDEYDNFANEVMMSAKRRGQDRYLELVKGEGMFKTLFKNIKSAGSGDGLDRVFMTGVSPIVLNDVTSGANTFQDISWHTKVNALCGFTEEEIRHLLEQVVKECQLPTTQVEEIMQQMHSFYNGSRFIDDYYQSDEIEKVYNPTLSFYFLKEFQQKCNYPKVMIDRNLVPDDNKLAYIANYRQGKSLLSDALEEGKTVRSDSLREAFGLKDLLNPNLQRDRLAALVCYLGGLTSVGEEPDGAVLLEIPNLVMRRLYGERILEEITEEDETKIAEGRRAAHLLWTHGDVQPLCTFVETHLFTIYDNRDAKDFHELTLKTLFITLLYHTQLYLIDSEPAIEQRYGDLLMLVRPGMRERGLYDILIEFKHLSLKKVTEAQDGKQQRLDGEAVKAKSEDALMALDAVKAEFDDAKAQLQDYQQKLTKKYGDTLKLKTFAVVSVGFARILWEEISG